MRDFPSTATRPSFSLAEGRAHGLGRGALNRFDIPYRGIRLHRDAPGSSDLLTRALVYAPRLKPWQFFSHETALALMGVPVPWNAGIHVSTHRPMREPRIAGVTGHRLQKREAATLTSTHGLPVEDPVRAWRQCGLLWTTDALVIAADHLINPRRGGIEWATLADECTVMGDPRRHLARALDQARVGSDSPRETTLRLAIVRAGLPEPILAHELFDIRGTFVARLDLAYPRLRIAVEYDGRQHAFDVTQFERDADRWREIEAAGWQLVRILNKDLAGDGRAAVHLVREALARAGWRPGMAVA